MSWEQIVENKSEKTLANAEGRIKTRVGDLDGLKRKSHQISVRSVSDEKRDQNFS
jgi:hypothetical protein